mmetsp:Transcript_923/g.3868  ORF Transcript_923/g.3868 Transcript_923/m.3868 type:complete len:214 (+) Transcript_923:1128-1769(+)
MHGIVHRHEVQARGGLGAVGQPAVQQHGDVVVPVQEDQALLAEHDEERVHQLGDLGVDEQRGPQALAAQAVHAGRRVADGVCEVVAVQVVHQRRHRPHHAHEAEQAEEQVPRRQRAPQVPRLLVLHVLGPEVDHGHVQRQRNHGHFPVLRGELRDETRVEVALELKVRALQQRNGVGQLHIGHPLRLVHGALHLVQRHEHRVQDVRHVGGWAA